MSTQGRIVSQSTEYGDSSMPFRVRVAEAVGVLEYHYVSSARAGIELLAGELANTGIAADLEMLEDGEWSTWYDDRGADASEIIEEADGGDIVMLGDVLDGLNL